MDQKAKCWRLEFARQTAEARAKLCKVFRTKGVELKSSGIEVEKSVGVVRTHVQ